MHRDKRLGLSLAILLVGVVGAFFFRNDVEPSDPAPQLEDPEALDSRIAERPVTPYLTGIECDEEDEDDDPLAGYRPATVADNVSVTVEPTDVEPIRQSRESKQWEFPAFLRDERSVSETTRRESAPPIGEAALVPKPREIPEPIQIDIRDREPNSDVVERPIPNHNNAWETIERPAPEPKQRQPQKNDFVIHKVASGETLSALAARYLGSPNRFNDIFKVNRDVLKNPDDVQAGMKLKIPVKRAKGIRPSGNKAAHASLSGDGPEKRPKSKTPADSQTPPQTPKAKSRFVPAPRGSLYRSTSNRKDRTGSADSQSMKRLSQVPPKDVPVVDYDRSGFATSPRTNHN